MNIIKGQLQLCNGEWIQILQLKKTVGMHFFNKRGTHKMAKSPF